MDPLSASTSNLDDEPDEPPPEYAAQPLGNETVSTISNEQIVPSLLHSRPAPAPIRGRVRFNSTADVIQPPRIQPPTSFAPVHPADSVIKAPARRPPILRGNSGGSVASAQDVQEQMHSPFSDSAATAAHVRGTEMADVVRSESPKSACSSESGACSPTRAGFRTVDGYENVSPRDFDNHSHDVQEKEQEIEESSLRMAAQTLVRSHTQTYKQYYDYGEEKKKMSPEISYGNGGTYDETYDIATPETYRGGVLSQLLKLYQQPGLGKHLPSPGHSRKGSADSSELGTPARRKWYHQENNDSSDTLANLIAASAKLANPSKAEKAKHNRSNSRNRLSQLLAHEQREARITVHIEGILSRQAFLIKLCKALMLYGAPTHRLEEYLTSTAKALEIEASLLYLPGCMIIAFDDSSTHTTEVKLVRLTQAIDLGRLTDVHKIYKEVLHDVMGVEEATEKLDELMGRETKFHPWLRVFVFGLTSVFAAPFSFGARMIDLPLLFFFGCVVGFLQIIVAPKSNLYSNVFEVTATVIISFLARLFGSIQGGQIFCFSALAQGGIVMLLPGYLFLTSSLELQARMLIPGSIRIVYGVIYSLLLGFGIMIGAALYGMINPHATSEMTCTNPTDPLLAFIFVPFFVLCISILYQAKWRQIPVMVTVAFAGYVVNYFCAQKFRSSPAVAGAIGAFTVGFCANVWSRWRHWAAVTILIPAIFTQVPGSLASQGGLLSGLKIANELANGNHSTNAAPSTFDVAAQNSVTFTVASSMIEIAIGITVGLFFSALLVYPLGKRRSGLFSF